MLNMTVFRTADIAHAAQFGTIWMNEFSAIFREEYGDHAFALTNFERN